MALGKLQQVTVYNKCFKLVDLEVQQIQIFSTNSLYLSFFESATKNEIIFNKDILIWLNWSFILVIMSHFKNCNLLQRNSQQMTTKLLQRKWNEQSATKCDFLAHEELLKWMETCFFIVRLNFCVKFFGLEFARRQKICKQG